MKVNGFEFDENILLKQSKQFKEIAPFRLIVDTHTITGFCEGLNRGEIINKILEDGNKFYRINVQNILKDVIHFSNYFNHNYKLCYNVFQKKLLNLDFLTMSRLFNSLDEKSFKIEHECVRYNNNSTFQVMKNRMWIMGGVQYVRLIMQKYGYSKEDTVRKSKKHIIEMIKSDRENEFSNDLICEIIMLSCIIEDYKSTLNEEYFYKYCEWTMKNYGFKPLKKDFIFKRC